MWLATKQHYNKLSDVWQYPFVAATGPSFPEPG